MNYKIFGDMMPAVTVQLAPGEQMITQSGGMSWMTDGIRMETNMRGGLGGAFGRMLSGESLFMATFTATRPGDEITFASTMPGQILPFTLRPGYELIAQKGAFLCAEPGVQLSAYLTRGVKGGLFGGEGFVLQRLSGQGMVFCEMDGSICVIDLAPGERLRVDSGNIAAFEASVGYSAEMVRGFKNILFGGEGLFLSTLTGPGRVWLQTMTTSELAKRIIPYIPTKSD
ncbi:MAG: TIGR00266 family protein [Eubacteriales bacterium]|nr:TIGR00266 family protein [Eubacteriales bacterium]